MAISSAELPRKKSLPRSRRFFRLIGSLFDPRAWAHVAKIVNYYNYSHVVPLRSVTFDGERNVSPDAVFQNGERIRIGENARIGSRCHFWAGPAHGRIVIGKHALFGPEVLITAASYRYNDGSPVTEQAMDEADVIVGDDVWVATRAVLLPGTVLGDGTIVGAGAMVRGEFPAMSILAGSPARIVGERRTSGLKN
ncbi:acyltransferase [Aurantiacibacter aquimixticola]|uniref:Acyltransferase n=2 Tax=Aurantiacibacter aquimixticola TaxID=1958945 RepID=A0A419RWX9_9SPHN|nr:acyltransferase [Aurantiacibacter aquimixticola]